MNQELSDTLDRLHHELQSTTNLDEASKNALAKILEEIHGVLYRAPSASQSTPNVTATGDSFSQISKRWQAIVDEFELNHPQFTAVVSQISERLTDMGI